MAVFMTDSQKSQQGIPTVNSQFSVAVRHMEGAVSHQWILLPERNGQKCLHCGAPYENHALCCCVFRVAKVFGTKLDSGQKGTFS